MPRMLLCSMTVPWPDRPTQGQYHLDQAVALAENGIETTVLSPAPIVPPGLGRLSGWARRHAQRPRSYEMRGVTIRSPRIPFAYPNVLRQRLAAACPRAVGWYCRRALGGALASAIRETHADQVLLHGMLPWGGVGRVARQHGAAVGVIEHSAGDVMRLRRGTALGDYYRRLARGVKRVFVVNRAMKDRLEHELDLTNVSLAINGVEMAGMPRRHGPRPRRYQGKTLVLSAAHYYRRKGFEPLLQAMAPLLKQREDLALVLITDRIEPLRQLAESLGIAGRVELLPLCDRSTLMQWMSWADLFALPSWSESFGLVYAEAMHCGTPVLMTSDAGMSQELPKGLSPGWVVPPRDPWALNHALADALSSRERLGHLGRMAAQWVAGRFSWQRNADVIATGLLG